MDNWSVFLLDVLKITLPALIVGWVVARILNRQHQRDTTLKMLEIRQGAQNITLPARLQAYERLSLFCERMELPNLLLRARGAGMNVSQLRVALLLAIQEEFDHNVAQQLYVSEKLWDIIRLAKDDAVNMVSAAAAKVNPSDEGQRLADAIIKLVYERAESAQSKALKAIRKESGLLFG